MTPTQRDSLEYAYREEEMTMMTVNEVSKLTGVSIRTLQYYDTIGLLKPIEYTESGYRLYDDTSLERLQQILLFKELEFPFKEIKKIIDAPNFDRNKALYGYHEWKLCPNTFPLQVMGCRRKGTYIICF